VYGCSIARGVAVPLDSWQLSEDDDSDDDEDGDEVLKEPTYFSDDDEEEMQRQEMLRQKWLDRANAPPKLSLTARAIQEGYCVHRYHRWQGIKLVSYVSFHIP
jgi:hypothetical protein